MPRCMTAEVKHTTNTHWDGKVQHAHVEENMKRWCLAKRSSDASRLPGFEGVIFLFISILTFFSFVFFFLVVFWCYQLALLTRMLTSSSGEMRRETFQAPLLSQTIPMYLLLIRKKCLQKLILCTLFYFGIRMTVIKLVFFI